MYYTKKKKKKKPNKQTKNKNKTNESERYICETSYEIRENVFQSEKSVLITRVRNFIKEAKLYKLHNEYVTYRSKYLTDLCFITNHSMESSCGITVQYLQRWCYSNQ